jgi:site-specific recombinase XerD
VGSSPTPGAIVVDSSEYFISLNQQNNIVKSLQEPTGKENKVKVGKEKIKEKIDLICKYQKPFVKKSLENLLTENIDNTEIICNYIIAEQNEINIKESTKEGKIKVLADLLRFLKHKALSDVSKEDILSYLNRFRKPEEIDAKHSWIGTWNNRHLILSKFIRWLYDPNNPDIKNRKTPDCMKGVKRLTRKEVSRYKPSDLWTQRECEIFLKYCPFKRDKAFLAMAMDTSARPHELLNLKINDIKFKTSSDGSKHYAEITINGKTGQRTVIHGFKSQAKIDQYLNDDIGLRINCGTREMVFQFF